MAQALELQCASCGTHGGPRKGEHVCEVLGESLQGFSLWYAVLTSLEVDY